MTLYLPVMDRLLIAGAGATGALCACFLTRTNVPDGPTSVTVLDKGRGAGGRMSTSRATKEAMDKANYCSADLGAQYFTAMENQWNSEAVSIHRAIYDELLEAGIFKPLNGQIENDDYDYSKQKWTAPNVPKSLQNGTHILERSSFEIYRRLLCISNQGGTAFPSMKFPVYEFSSIDELKHFVATNGSSSVVKHFLNKSNNTTIKFNETIESISLSEDKTCWHVTTKEGLTADFDGIVLTMPVPQILQMKGNIRELFQTAALINIKTKLEKVSYSSRYALAAWFASDASLDVNWSAKYFFDDPCIRYVSIDPKKRGVQTSDTGTVVVVHTSVPYGLQHLEDDVELVKGEIMSRLKIAIPQLQSLTPLSVKCQRWRYSQVYKAYEGAPGCVVVQSSPLLVLAGDGFVSMSHFDGCVDSALAAEKAVRQAVRAA